jgi:hypothetical protein
MTLDEMETPSCRATSGANAPERACGEKPQTRIVYAEAQLKKLLNEAVTLHRDICTCNGSVLLPLAGGNL